MGEVNGDFNGVGEEDERVHEWEVGLPNADDITPLNFGLIPPALLSAFNIKPAPSRTAGEVSRASDDTISMIRGQAPASDFKAFDENKEDDEIEDGSDLKKSRRNESPEDADSAAAKTLKRPRLVWTPQLHKRFVEVVAHLGLKNAVPKTIMQLMNVEGLTRENVASHLQKYRLYLKRMQGGGGSFFDGPSNSSSAAASSEPPVNLPENGNSNGNVAMPPPPQPVPIQMPYGGPPPMMPMPMMMGMPHGHMGMANYGGFDSNHHNHNHNHHQQQQQQQQQQHQQQQNQYSNGMMMMQSGNKYGSVMPYHHHHQSQKG